MKWWQIILWPFGFLYGSIMAIRNIMYDLGWFSSTSFDVPTIVVGNLEIGGSGKSPFVDFITAELKQKYKIGILSRGYGRQSKGYRVVDYDAEAASVGDESLMLKWKHPEAYIAVCENRVIGIRNLLIDYPFLDCIILDDAYQHRRLKAGHYVLLSSFANPFYKDFVIPAGRLREFVYGWRRTNQLVVTKTPPNLSDEKKKEWMRYFKIPPSQSIFFAEYVQGELMQVFGIETPAEKQAILVTGIAHALDLKRELSKSFEIIEHISNADHCKYDHASFRFTKGVSSTNTIITTAKDWVKWQPFLSDLAGWRVYIVPVEVKVDRSALLLKELKEYIEMNKYGVRKS